MSERRCAVCGADISHRDYRARYCGDCAIARQKKAHADHLKRKRNEWKKSGLCIECGKAAAAENRRLCQDCLDKYRKQTRERYHFLMGNGRCVVCGKEKEPSRKNNCLCFSCATKIAEKRYISYHRRKKQNVGD